MLEDTIIAIATPPGPGGLGIVRISGREARIVANSIFEPRSGRIKAYPERQALFGSIRDPDGRSALDEAFLTYFRAPRSYTREDVVEISVHGSPAVLEAILRTGVKAGARLARPGEFTLRAFLNGRLDIIQAEAVNDLIRSVSLTQARISARQLGGSLSRRAARLRERLVSLMATVEAGLEFPEERLRSGPSGLRRSLASVIDDIERLVGSHEAGRALGQGVTLAIVGRANVGKSTLFNALLGEERAIVTPFAGTTRDFLRERLIIEDVVFNIVDMAGLGPANHPVERRGIARGRKIADQADGLLVVLDGSKKWCDEDDRLVRRYGKRKAVFVLNKTDLPRRMDRNKVGRMAGENPLLEISALKGKNLGRLLEAMRAHFVPPIPAEQEILLHARQKDRLEAALEALRRAAALLAGRHSEEIPAEEIRSALISIGELTGEVRAEEILDDIFGRFCVGK